MTQIKFLWADRHMRNGIIVTIICLLIIRLFYVVPTPGINATYFKELLESNGALSFIDVFTGNGLSSMSVMMLNITPYITASIIMQLLGDIFKRIHEMQNGMRDEQKKIENATIILGIVLAFAESLILSVSFGRQKMYISYSWYWVLIVAAIWTMGSAATSIIGKKLQDKYQINGVSLILLLNILAGYPSAAKSLYSVFIAGRSASGMAIAILIIALIIAAFFVFTYYIQETVLPIPVNYASQGDMPVFLEKGTMPIRLCPGSVIPVIFASSIMTTPVLIASAFTDTEALWAKILSPGCWFVPGDWLPTVGVAIYLLLIIGFSFYYANITLNPKEVAEKLNKGAGVIPGVRPGPPTEQYLKKQMHKIVWVGAIALCLIALAPIVVSGLFNMPKISFLGTSVIIIVGVLLEVKRFLFAQSKKGHYKAEVFEGGLF